MCTLVLLHRPGSAWPVLAAANRDEMLDRPWAGPAAHWPDLPQVVGGRDVLAGGTWFAVSAQGMLAGVLNRTGSLGPAAGKASRGDLPLLALRHGAAAPAARALGRLPAADWRGFNLILADRHDAFWLSPGPAGAMQVQPLAEGLSVVTALDPNDHASPRVARHYPRFAAAPPPCPPDWGYWPALMSDQQGPWEAAISLPPRAGFGTASSFLAAIPAHGPPQLRFCAGRPRVDGFAAVDFPGG